MAMNWSSPGIHTTEIDKSLSIVSAPTTTVGTVGEFSWGECYHPIFPYDEPTLIEYMGKPVERNVKHFIAARDILSYGRNLALIRIVDEATAKNATLDDSKTGIYIGNRTTFSTMSKSAKTGMRWAAKFPGTLGNSLEVSLADANTFDNWKYAHLFSDKPSTSNYAKKIGAKNDEVHVVVVDRGGLFTGTPNSILDRFEFLSKAVDGKTDDLTPNYFVNYINERSKYVWFMSNPDTNEYDTTTVVEATTEWGTPLIDPMNAQPSHYKNLKMPEHGIDGSTAPSSTNPHLAYGGQLGGGQLGNEVDDQDFIKGWDVFRNPEQTEVGVLCLGSVPDTDLIRIGQHVIDKVITTRQDCVLTISPPLEKILNKTNTEICDNLIQFFDDLARQSNYVFMTCNYFLEYDQHTDTTHWIPDNVGTAGLMVRTDDTDEPWFSPAGYNRGIYKNVIKTAWNPAPADLDRLYKYSINGVYTSRGHGTVLYGDRTLVTRPSSLRQIGVRRLLIQLRSLITNAAKYTLFEFNDHITRSQFVALVTPYLQQVQAARGLDSFKVVCDTTNNTPQVIDEQRFVADILIRPLYSINYINLNFILVNNTISFKENTNI